MPLLDPLACACPLCTKEERETLRGLAPAWNPWSSWLASWAPREVPHLDLSASPRASLRKPCLRKRRVVRLARVLNLVLMKMGHVGPPLEPRHRPQAGKSGDPRSQNTDSSPRAQGAPALGLAKKRKGKREALWAPIACGLRRRVVIDWTWASALPM